MQRVFLIFFSILWVLLDSGCQTVPVPAETKDEAPVFSNAVSPHTVETLLYRKIAKMRQEHDLAPLETDHDLAAVARKHSRNMVQKNFFSHLNTSNETPTDRGLKDGYLCRIIDGNLIREGIAENIFKTSLYRAFSIRGSKKEYQWRDADELAQSVLDQWMASEGHARNLLSTDYAATGIGAASTLDYQILITQDFC